MDMVEVYRITMGKYSNTLYFFWPYLMCSILVLHPHHKLKYFKTAGWLDTWIETTENLVHDEFQRSYSSIARLDDKEDTDVDMESADKGQSTKVCYH